MFDEGAEMSETTQAEKRSEQVFKPERLEGLRSAVKVMEQRINGLLEERKDKEAQKDHLEDVSLNSKEILRDLLGRELSEGEGLQVDLAVLTHDWGKWEKGENIRAFYEAEQRDEILTQMGLSPEEEHILDLGVQATKGDSYNFHRTDIAHHLFSAGLFLAETQEGGSLSDLDPEDVRIITDTILEHQFAGYYQWRATRINMDEGEEVYSKKDVDAIRREHRLEKAYKAYKDGRLVNLRNLEERFVRTGDNEGTGRVRSELVEETRKMIEGVDPGILISAAVHDGDKLCMGQHGRVDEEGRLHLGGYGKVVGIVTALIARDRGEGETDPFASANRSMWRVGEELLTSYAKEEFIKVVPHTMEFADELVAEGFMDLVHKIPGLKSEDEEISGPAEERFARLMDEVNSRLRKKAREIVVRSEETSTVETAT